MIFQIRLPDGVNAVLNCGGASQFGHEETLRESNVDWEILCKMEVLLETIWSNHVKSTGNSACSSKPCLIEDSCLVQSILVTMIFHHKPNVFFSVSWFLSLLFFCCIDV